MAGRIQKLLIGTAVAAVVLGAAEAAARVALGPPTATAAELSYDPDPDAGFRVAANFINARAKTNSFGMRGREPDLTTPRRVLVLGDSMTFGAEVNDDQTFCALLEKELGAGTQVLNAGCPGYGPLEYYYSLRRLEPAVHPTDVLVFLFLGNDIAESGRDLRYGVIGGKLVGRSAYDDAGTAGRAWMRFAAAAHDLGLVRAMRRIRGGATPPPPPAPGVGPRGMRPPDTGPLGMDSPEVRCLFKVQDYRRLDAAGGVQAADGWRRMPDHLKHLRDAADGAGVTLRCIILPMPITYDPDLRVRMAKTWGVGPGSIDASLPARRVTEVLQQCGMFVADLSDAFAAAPEKGLLHMPNDLHLSPEGHRLVALETAKIVR